jgi:HKD family nuclease
MIIYVLIPVVSGEDVLISYQIEYLMENPIDGKEIITYTFKNINESSSFTLDYVFSTTIRATNIKVTDAPAGFVTYDIKQTGATSVITLSFKRTLTPFEDYTITITGDVSGISEMLGGNFYRFRDIEFANLGNPEQGTRLNDMGVKIYFPNSIWYTYRVTSISSDAVIIYGIAGVKQIIWRFEHPQSQIATFVEFEEMLNPVTFNVIGFVILLTAFMILYYTSRTSEIKLKQMGITKVFPGASDTVARLREMLKDAKEEILITFPLIYYTDWLTAELKPALDRGVRVRVLTWPCYERRQFESVEEVYEDRKQKFTLKRFLEMFPPGVVKINDNIHSKMVVVDRKRILITSANLTQTGLWENYEVGIWAENESLAEEGASYFEMVWNSFESVELTEEMLDAKNSWLAIMKRKEERGRDEI